MESAPEASPAPSADDKPARPRRAKAAPARRPDNDERAAPQAKQAADDDGEWNGPVPDFLSATLS
jgi:hypothetical protein